MAAEGRPVEVVSIPGVTHGFDQEEKALFSTLEFDAGAAEAAVAMTLDFLTGVE
jgi:dienelactone hydrolase